MSLLDSFYLIQNPNKLLISVLEKKNIPGGFGDFRVPNEEENNYYKDDIVYKLIDSIWKKEVNSLKLKKINPNLFSIPVPQLDNSSLLLVSSQVVSGTNYEAIVSVITNQIDQGTEKNYYLSML